MEFLTHWRKHLLPGRPVRKLLEQELVMGVGKEERGAILWN